MPSWASTLSPQERAEPEAQDWTDPDLLARAGISPEAVALFASLYVDVPVEPPPADLDEFEAADWADEQALKVDERILGSVEEQRAILTAYVEAEPRGDWRDLARAALARLPQPRAARRPLLRFLARHRGLSRARSARRVRSSRATRAGPDEGEPDLADPADEAGCRGVLPGRAAR